MVFLYCHEIPFRALFYVALKPAKMISIDKKIISAHQWIVDETERQPAWWVEQTAWAFIAADIVAAALTWNSSWNILLAAMTLGVGALMIFASRNPAALAAGAEKSMPWRMLFLALAAHNAFALFMQADVGRAAHLLGTLLLTSCHYFAACQPPRPRKRRQHSTQRGTA